MSRWGCSGIVLTLAAMATVGWAGDDTPPRPKPLAKEIEHRPTAIPDRIILTFVGDPATTMAVTWRTDTTVEKAVAEIAVAESWRKFEDKARPFNAVTAPLTTDLGEAHYHSATFTDLTPETKYVYRVGDGVNWSAWIQFTTASQQAKPFSFIYFGDAQNELKAHWSRVIRQAWSDMPKAHFLLHAGDLINSANRDQEWGEWFNAGGWVNAMVPNVVTPGNHEYGAQSKELKNAGIKQLSRHWRPQFTLPENGPSGLEETAYWFDYQGVRIVSLNSNEKLDVQTKWLDEVLSHNPNRWTVLTFHHPVFSTAKGRDNAKLRELWKPVIDKHRVDLVLTGHDHTYGRSGLIDENLPLGVNRADPSSGTVYVVSVSGPKMYTLDESDWMRKWGEDVQLYQLLQVDGDRLRYEARTAVGELFDRFELRKNAMGWNRLVERSSLELEERRGTSGYTTGEVALIVGVLAAPVALLVLLRLRRRTLGVGEN